MTPAPSRTLPWQRSRRHLVPAAMMRSREMGKNLLQNQYCKSATLQLRNLNKNILNIHEQLICKTETTSPDRCVATLCCEVETGGPGPPGASRGAESGRGCTALRGETLPPAARGRGVWGHGPSVGDLLREGRGWASDGGPARGGSGSASCREPKPVSN